MAVKKLSNIGGIGSIKTTYPNMLTNYGDFGAMQRIAYLTASGSSNSFSFTSIPQTFQDLMVVVYARSTNASTTSNGIMTINNDSSNSNYAAAWLNSDGSSATSNRDANFAQLYTLQGMPAASATSGIFSSGIIHILNYKNTSIFKTLLIRQAADLNSSGLTRFQIGLWRGTPAAITSFNINTFNGNYAVGSTAALYGIKASAI